jgi:hypothetical protein
VIDWAALICQQRIIIMPERERLLNELGGDNDVGVLLLAQLGGTPNELQLFIQTAQYDPQGQLLRERPGGFIIRAINAQEHRLSLGLFVSLFFAGGHPILLHHNEPKLDVYFEGTPHNISELVLDIHQAYASTFGPWRELAADINRDQPLYNLLQSGQGRLGTMPRTAAERMVKVLAHHGLTGRLQGDADAQPDPQWKLLGVGDSYVVALDFAVDRMGSRQQAG